jgi:hypothetical protein
MEFIVRLTGLAEGPWLATHESRDAGNVTVRAATRNEALEKIEGEIRYRLELCPCSGATWQHLAIQVIEERDKPAAR